MTPSEYITYGIFLWKYGIVVFKGCQIPISAFQEDDTMNAQLIKYAIMAVLAAVSGFFLVGFIIFSISVLLSKKPNQF